MGVVAVETRTVEMTTPADPANLDSEFKVFIHRVMSYECVGPLSTVFLLYHDAQFYWWSKL